MNDNQLIFEAYLESAEQPKMYTNSDGTAKYWCIGTKYHREDGPAIEYSNGLKEWWLNGKRHRADGGPTSVHPDGRKIWRVNDLVHREDGPACITPDGKEYFYLDDEQLTPQKWAEKVLQKQGKPADPESVKEFLRPILAKQTKDLI